MYFKQVSPAQVLQVDFFLDASCTTTDLAPDFRDFFKISGKVTKRQDRFRKLTYENLGKILGIFVF